MERYSLRDSEAFFFGGGGGALAKTTFPLHLTDTIIFKGSFSIAPTMPHSYKIPHKFCSGGDLTDYYGICSHERDLLADAILCTDLIIRDCHEREGHVGAGQILASIRQKFWILRVHAAVRRVIGKCLKCRFWKAKPCE